LRSTGADPVAASRWPPGQARGSSTSHPIVVFDPADIPLLFVLYSLVLCSLYLVFLFFVLK
jgi:hypothetical protein